MNVSNKFQAADGVGKFLAGAGWVVVVAAAIGGLIAIGQEGGKGAIIGVPILVLGVSFGLVIVANGQLIQIMVAIEHNTRNTMNLSNRSISPASLDNGNAICPGCGATNDASSSFCEICGTKL